MTAPGTVYGAILNVRQELDRLSEKLSLPPYGKPPLAPVLYIKPPNTVLLGGGQLTAPAETDVLEMGATLALVMARPACRVAEDQALAYVGGFAVAIDVTIPHANLHRPAIRQRCRDGFLPLSRWRRASPGFDPDRAEIAVEVNGRRELSWSTSDLVRSTARLLAEVTDFMTLATGDVLLVGLHPDAPRARAGDGVRAVITGVGEISCALVAEPGL